MDWTYGLLLILSAVVGALTGIFGQSLKEWWARPKLNLDLCKKENRDGDRTFIYLVIGNKGRSSSQNMLISIKKICKGGGSSNQRSVDIPDVNPKDYLIYYLGGMSMHDSSISIYKQGECDVDGTSIRVIVSSFNVKSIDKTYELSKQYLESLSTPPSEGIELN